MNTEQLITAENKDFLARQLWPFICEVLQVDPATVLRPEVHLLHARTISIVSDTGGVDQGGVVYLPDDEPVYITTLGHELAHAVIRQSPNFDGQRDFEYLPQMVQEAIARA